MIDLLTLAAAVVAVVVLACALTSLLRPRRRAGADVRTVPSGRARLEGNRFVVPLDLPQGRASVRLFFDPDGAGPGCPRFVHDGGAVRVVHHDEAGVLLHVYGRASAGGRLAFVFVVDPSTGTPALLRVPPHLRRAREAVAWTFGMDERDWLPVAET
jgi:hypothetical protein